MLSARALQCLGRIRYRHRICLSSLCVCNQIRRFLWMASLSSFSALALAPGAACRELLPPPVASGAACVNNVCLPCIDTRIPIGMAESCSRRQSNRTACRCLSAAPIASGVPAGNRTHPLLLSAKARICQDRLGASPSSKKGFMGRKGKEGEGLRFPHRCVPAPAQTAPARSGSHPSAPAPAKNRFLC